MRRNYRIAAGFSNDDNAIDDPVGWSWRIDVADGAAAMAAGPGRAGDRFPTIDYGIPADDPEGAAGQGGMLGNVAASGDARIDGLLSGRRWANPAITYTDPDAADDFQAGYFMDTNGNNISAQNEGFGRISAQQLYAVQYALDDASLGQPAGARGYSVAGFTNLGISYGTPGSGAGTIRVSNTADNNYGYAYYPADGIYGGDAWLGTALRTPTQGNYEWNNTLHELGHALGLKHGQEIGGPANRALPTQNDSLEYTLMTYRSYVGAGLRGYSNGLWDYPQTFMMLDIATLQYMYGADFTSNAGNTTYTWSPTTGQSFVDGALATNPGDNRIFMTIWDGGGVDTYDLSNYAVSLRIDLRPGEWSSFDDEQRADLGNGRTARGNVANALQYQGDARSLIENAIGGSGVDTIIGNAVANRLDGGASDDLIDGDEGNDTLVGDAGDDLLFGANGADTLIGGTGSDLLNGGSGDDLLIGGKGVDNIDGGDGIDTASYTELGYGIAATLTPDVTFAGLEVDRLSNVENLTGSAFGDILHGDAGANFIEGLAGNDTINGRGGGDTLSGGDGIDTLSFELGATGLITVFLNRTTRQDTGMGVMLLLEFENVRGTGFDDVLTGSAADNRIEGGGGDDTLSGLRGDDYLDGQAGGDRMIGGAGNDIYVVDDIGDRTTERANEGIDTVIASITTRLAAEVENLQLAGVEDLDGFGNELANRIEGNDGANRIDGGAGVDTMIGGKGDDIYLVDSSADVVIERAGEGDDTVLSSADYVLSGAIEKLVLGGSARIGTGNRLNNLIIGSGGGDTLSGLDGKDTINGGLGADTIDGGIGDDMLTGGGGRDTLTGGSGADRFVFDFGDTGSTLATADRIVDFSQTEGDRIVLSAIDEIRGTPGNDAFTYIGTTSFSRAAGELRYEIVRGATMVYGDVDGDGAADLAIRLTGTVTLVSADFAL